MKIIIVSNSRSGSTNLMKSIASANNLTYIFEPYYKTKVTDVPIGDNVVIKTLINHMHIDEYKKLIPNFDKVIFLSRMDELAMAESLVSSMDLGKKWNYDRKFKAWELPYEYKNTDMERIEKARQFYVLTKFYLNKLAESFDTKVDYYEDIYLNNMGLHDKTIKLDKKYLSPELRLRKNI